MTPQKRKKPLDKEKGPFKAPTCLTIAPETGLYKHTPPSSTKPLHTHLRVRKENPIHIRRREQAPTLVLFLVISQHHRN